MRSGAFSWAVNVASDETPKAAAAFQAYCLLGMDRSLATLAHMWGKNRAYVGQLERWSSQHDWQERVKLYDAEQSRIAAEAIAAEKAKILTSRYALMHKRIEALDKLAQKLEDYMEEEENIWLPDVKSVGSGPLAQRVDLVTFNDALISEYRATFADIAAEMGERVKVSKNEHTGKDGKPIQTQLVEIYKVRLPDNERDNAEG